MNKHLFSSIVSNTDQLDEKSLSQLKEVIDEYPFFQMGRMLILKNLHKLDHIKFNSDLKHSAAYIADRNKLYFLLHNLSSPLITEELTVEEPEEKVITEEPKVAISNETVAKTKESKTVSITDNYLAASEDLTDSNGVSVVFCNPNAELNIKDKRLDDIVLPSADLLDYERSAFSAYSITDLEKKKEVEPNTSHSFSDWLLMMKNKRAEVKKAKDSNIKMDLIENFLSENPKITPIPDKPKQDVDLAEARNKESEDIMSETLANIFIKQGHNSKAILILEKLRLKYPEKNVYFARRITELKEN